MEQRFASRCEGLTESATLKLTAKIKELERAGQSVISYGAGEPHFDPPAFLFEAVRAALDRKHAKYTPVLGLIEVRESLAAWVNKTYRLSVQPSCFALTNGAKGAIHMALQVLLNPSDEVIFQSPYWVSYPPLVNISGGVPKMLQTRLENRWRITPEQLQKTITPKTKVFLFCSPHNPTGVAYSQAEIDGLADVLRAHPQVWVISDDIYDHVIWDLRQRAHFAFSPNFTPNSDQGRRLILVQGLSKSHGVTGWRAGYVCANADLIQKINILMGHALGHVSAITQHVMHVAYTQPFDFLKSWVAYYQNNMDIALPLLKKMGAECVTPEGAFYLFPKVTGLYGPLSEKFGVSVRDDVSLCELLLDRLHIGLVPGTEFGAPGHIRLSTAMTAEHFQEGLTRLVKALESS